MTLELECRHSFPGGFSLDVACLLDAGVTSLFGPSGSGKTTLLMALAGLCRPDRGRIVLDGVVLTDTSRGVHVPAHRRQIGVVFQDHLLFPHLTVERNLRYGAARRPRRAAGVPLARVVDVLELGDLLARRPETLSGGQRQRVALGRALLSAPRLLLLDEPLAALDDALKVRILAYLERVVAEWRIPAIFVSHHQAEVRRLADEVVVLDAGRVLAQGPPEAALTTPALLAWTGAIGPMNVLRVDAVERRAGRLLGRIGGQTLHLPTPLGAGRSDAVPSGAGWPEPRFVEFAPGSVVLARHEVQDLSVRNHLRGVVRRIVELDSGVFAAVDVGQVLWAAVTPQAVSDLELGVGAEVVCLIKTHGLRVLE